MSRCFRLSPGSIRRPARRRSSTRSGLTDTGLFAIAGNRLNSIYPPAWIGWLSEHEPRFADGMVRWVFVGDWLAYRLSGVLATDYSITSQTLTLDQTRASAARRAARCVRARPGSLPLAQTGGGDDRRGHPQARAGDRVSTPVYRWCSAAPTGSSASSAPASPSRATVGHPHRHMGADVPLPA